LLFIYLVTRETCEEWCCVFLPVSTTVFCYENWENSTQASRQIYKKKNTWAETQVCLVSASDCRLSCHCVPWSNMFAIKLKRLEWQSLWAHYPLRTMQCDSEMADEI